MVMTRREKCIYLMRLEQTIKDLKNELTTRNRLKDPEAFDIGLFDAVEALVVCYKAIG